MKFKIQNASLLKRVAAALLDLILLAVVATGGMFLLSAVTGYDSYAESFDSYLNEYAAKYGIETFDISDEAYSDLSAEARSLYDSAYSELLSAPEVMRIYSMLTSLLLLIPSLGIFFAYAILEFAVPLFLKNGQTVGKKVFELGVIRCDGVKVSPLMLFARTLLGKFTVETMIPLLLLVMSGIFGLAGLLVIALISLLQVALLVITKHRTVIHDAFAQSVVVDLPTQLVFDTAEELIAYKARIAAEDAAKSDY